MLAVFPEGFEEADRGERLELAAYTDARGEERARAEFGDVVLSEVPSDWEERWKRFHRPAIVAGLWVGPPWETPPPSGAAVVIDPEQPGPGIVTERDLLDSVGAGQSPDTELVADHLSSNLTFAEPTWSLERAAEAMVRGGFRHLVVVDGGETVGVLSMRDIVRCWTGVGATCEVPA